MLRTFTSNSEPNIPQPGPQSESAPGPEPVNLDKRRNKRERNPVVKKKIKRNAS